MCSTEDAEFNGMSISEALNQMFENSHYCIYDDTEDDDVDDSFMSAIRRMSGN